MSDLGPMMGQELPESVPHPLSSRQCALECAIEGVVEQFGQFDQTSGPDGSHYVEVSPFARDGLVCANCEFYDGARSCEVVAGDIAPDAVCKFWIIPADLVGRSEATMSDNERSASVESAVRMCEFSDSVSLRSTDDGKDVMRVKFAVFDQWTEINSRAEGHFLERIAPGAFDNVLRSNGTKFRVLYEHGKDPQVGNKPIGTPLSVRSARDGVIADVELFDASYVNDLKPAIRAGQLGASFRFGIDDSGVKVDYPTAPTPHNPDMLPERTIVNIKRVPEFGPVTFGAYPMASTGMRSGTDWFLDSFADPLFVARFTEMVGLKNVEPLLESLRAAGQRESTAPDARAAGQTEGIDARVLKYRAVLATHRSPSKDKK